MQVLSSSTGMAKQLQLVERENFQQSFSLIQSMNNRHIDTYVLKECQGPCYYFEIRNATRIMVYKQSFISN